MQQVFDGNGKQITLSNLVGKGGEGSVYAVSENADVVAKIYHEMPNATKAAKLSAMAALRTPSLSEMTAWPLATLHSKSSSGPLVGLLMHRVVGYKEAHALYSPKSRRTEFSNANWTFLIHSAANSARAFARVHQHGHVIGDVNHGNVLIGSRATVMMIDCDSFQIQPSNGKPFLCEVGVPTYTPPELQGKALNTVVRAPNHDNFGLAVLIFHLLFMGRHPFAGRFLGRGDMPIESAIREYRFAFGANSTQTLMQPPPNTLPLSGISAELCQLFDRAFSTSGSHPGARGTASEWVTALDAMEKQVKRCSVNPAHDYLRSMAACPWCDIEGKTGGILFSVHIVSQSASGTAFQINIVWEKIVSVGIVPPPPPLPSRDSFAMTLEAEPASKQEGKRRRVGNGIGIALVSISIGLLLITANAVLGFWLIAGSAICWRFIAWKVSTSMEQNVWNEKLAEAMSHCQVLEKEWKEQAGANAFTELRKRLETLAQEHNALPATRQKILRNLEADREKAQLKQYLESKFIQPGIIPKIGPGRIATLASFGIETAADVTAAALESVPGFGPVYRTNLLMWRHDVEQRFVFNPALGVDPAQIRALDASIVGRRNEIEKFLLTGHEQLERIKIGISGARNRILPTFEAQMRNRVQAELNLKAL
jgi:DNA-binding helix-hairpin-helix protein with protein kinase domain